MNEQELMKRKWWDYRLVHHDIATMMFILECSRQLPEYLERLGGSRYTNILKTFDVENPKSWTNWNLAESQRKRCDAHCINYKQFWRLATLKHEEIGWRATFINSFCGEKMFGHVLKAHNDYKAFVIETSDNDFFKASGYKGCKIQKAYHFDIVMKINKKYGASSVRVVKSMIDDGVLSERYFLGG